MATNAPTSIEYLPTENYEILVSYACWRLQNKQGPSVVTIAIKPAQETAVCIDIAGCLKFIHWLSKEAVCLYGFNIFIKTIC